MKEKRFICFHNRIGKVGAIKKVRDAAFRWMDHFALGQSHIEGMIERANSSTVKIVVSDDVNLPDAVLATEDVTPETRRLA